MADIIAGIRSKILTIRWPRDHDPALLTNFETHARRLRYRQLAYGCLSEDLQTLFLGHHLSDQVETIIQRLVRNKRIGLAGLSGIRPVNSIPCCNDIYGASDGFGASPLSSLLGDMSTYLQTRQESSSDSVSSSATKAIVGYSDYLGSSQVAEVVDSVSSPLPTDKPFESASGPSSATEDSRFPDGILVSQPGIQIYRPLLAFPKTRLLATCQTNGVPFVTDPSNSEPTTTQRNAIRWLVSNKKLPSALEQNSILRLGAASANVEVARNNKIKALMNATQLRSFDLRSSRLVVLVPMDVCEVFNASEQEAAYYLSHLLDLVSPDQENLESPLGLTSIARWMFPELWNPGKSISDSPLRPRSCTARGVMIERRPGLTGRCWSITRRPFTAQEKPERTFSPAPRYAKGLDGNWSEWVRFDGRYWIRIRANDPEEVRQFKVRELRRSDMKELNAMRREEFSPLQRQLRKVLQDTAPGRLRYTLPVLVREDKVQVFPTLDLRIPPKDPPQCVNATDIMAGGLRWEVRYKSVGETLKCLKKSVSDNDTFTSIPDNSTG